MLLSAPQHIKGSSFDQTYQAKHGPQEQLCFYLLLIFFSTTCMMYIRYRLGDNHKPRTWLIWYRKRRHCRGVHTKNLMSCTCSIASSWLRLFLTSQLRCKCAFLACRSRLGTPLHSCELVAAFVRFREVTSHLASPHLHFLLHACPCLGLLLIILASLSSRGKQLLHDHWILSILIQSFVYSEALLACRRFEHGPGRPWLGHACSDLRCFPRLVTDLIVQRVCICSLYGVFV